MHAMNCCCCWFVLSEEYCRDNISTITLLTLFRPSLKCGNVLEEFWHIRTINVLFWFSTSIDTSRCSIICTFRFCILWGVFAMGTTHVRLSFALLFSHFIYCACLPHPCFPHNLSLGSMVVLFVHVLSALSLNERFAFLAPGVTPVFVLSARPRDEGLCLSDTFECK